MTIPVNPFFELISMLLAMPHESPVSEAIENEWVITSFELQKKIIGPNVG